MVPIHYTLCFTNKHCKCIDFSEHGASQGQKKRVCDDLTSCNQNFKPFTFVIMHSVVGTLTSENFRSLYPSELSLVYTHPKSMKTPACLLVLKHKIPLTNSIHALFKQNTHACLKQLVSVHHNLFFLGSCQNGTYWAMWIAFTLRTKNDGLTVCVQYGCVDGDTSYSLLYPSTLEA